LAEEMDTCHVCGVPRFITGEHLWLDNGDIVQARDQANRLVFMECENIEPVFRLIERTIGFPIERIVITAMRRAVRSYITHLIPQEVKEKIRKSELDPVPLARSLTDVARYFGYGRIEILDVRNQGDPEDYLIADLYRPFSVSMVAATLQGAVEAVMGSERRMSYIQLFPGAYRVTMVNAPHPEELKGRMLMQPYLHRDGGLELERCEGCGGPAGLSKYRWDFQEGIITDTVFGRRMTLIGPAELEVVFDELEAELGESVSRVVIEAQRRFTRNGFFNLSEAASAEEFRTQLALRGMGNLEDISVDRNRLTMKLRNAALPLFVVGIMQGVYERALDRDSTLEWEVTRDSDLIIELRATR